MSSPNMLMRDPVLYRIRHAAHYRRGDAWCIYPLYDFAHCLEDAFEGVTHSICTLEFDNNRELYDWVLASVGFEEPRPHQYEWAGLDLEGAVLSKRFIKPLVEAGVVSGWDDPRLATLAAYRRRGIPPQAIRLLAELVGVSKTGARTEEAKLDFAIREVLNPVAPRVMAVLDPLKVVITNYAAAESEEIEAPYFPHDVPREGSRLVPFSREVWIERADFEEHPPKGFRRLVLDGEVRLRYAYVIRCDEVVKDAEGRVVELRCTYDPATRGGAASEGRKVKGTIQWVSAAHALDAEVRLFERLFADWEPTDLEVEAEIDVTGFLNAASLTRIRGAKVEPSVATDAVETRYQFERTGYFWRDPVDSSRDALVFNRIVALKDTWGRRESAEVEARAAAPLESSATGGRGPAVRSPAPQGAGASRAGADGPPKGRRRPRALDVEGAARAERYRSELGVIPEHAEVLASSPAFFEEALAEHGDAATVAAWIAVDLRGLLGDRMLAELPFRGAAIGRLVALVDEGRVSRRAARDVLGRMVEEGGDPERWIEALGVTKVGGPEALGAAVDVVLGAWPHKVDEYREGKKGLLGFFVGEVMKETRGAADPAEARHLLLQRLPS
jgi:glutaminyl-tRNA synthetase